mmetsp:Transcript_17259/g.47198  ORF Transcript_17259/g.47198 Transcript_17259/m.47198 type:complete len:116 (-) Transcript_17259:549-896(-)
MINCDQQYLVISQKIWYALKIKIFTVKHRQPTQKGGDGLCFDAECHKNRHEVYHLCSLLSGCICRCFRVDQQARAHNLHSNAIRTHARNLWQQEATDNFHQISIKQRKAKHFKAR